MADDNDIVLPPEVALTDLPLSGQPATDKGFLTANNTKIRVRVMMRHEEATIAPTNGDVAVSPNGYVLWVTIAKLNDDMSVATDNSGAFLITNRHELNLSGEAMANASFDPAAAIMQTIRQQAAVLEQSLANRAAATNYLASSWGHVTAPAPSGAALSPATSSTTVADILAASQASGKEGAGQASLSSLSAAGTGGGTTAPAPAA